MINQVRPPTSPSHGFRRAVPISVVFAGLWSVEVAGLELIINKITKTEPKFIVGDEGATIRDLGKLVQRESAHLLVIDDNLVPFAPEHSIPFLLRQTRTLKIVVLHSNPLNGKVGAYLRAGVRAVLDRNTYESDMPGLFIKVLQGHRFPDLKELGEHTHADCEAGYDIQELEEVRVDLLPRERLIIAGLVAGKRNKEIARDMNTSEQVIKNMLNRVYRKFGVKTRAKLASVILGYGEDSAADDAV
jgi:two-component system nitrate/nitrite response regulator NarL